MEFLKYYYHDPNSSRSTRNKNSFTFSCFKRKTNNNRLSIEQRDALARQRWAKIAKLRMIMLSISETRYHVQHLENQQIHGTVQIYSSPSIKSKKEIRKPYIIYPSYKWKDIYNLLYVLIITYFSLYVPYRVSFETPEQIMTPLDHETVFECLMAVDIILRFFTAYVDNYEEVDDMKKIGIHYLKGMFIIDVVAVLPLYMIRYYLLWLKLGRNLRLNIIFESFENLDPIKLRKIPFLRKRSQAYQKKILTLIKFLVHLIIGCHTTACMWYFLVNQSSSDIHSVVEAEGMSSSESYMYSLYFILVTLVTVGYGDITPQSNLEIFFTMVAEFLGILLFAYMMGKVSALLLTSNTQDTQTKEFDLDKWLMRLSRARLDKKLPTGIHIYMKSYYDYIWRHDFSELTNSDYIYRLPAKLREKLINNLFGFMIEKYSLFFSDCELKFCHSILMNMYPRHFQYGEEILSIEQDVTDVYFINSGSVAAGTKLGYQRFLRLPMSSFFGEEFVIFDSIPPMAFIADSDGVEILCVKKEAFMNSLMKYPKCFNKISAMAFRRGAYFRFEMYKSIKTCEHYSPEFHTQKVRTGIDLLIYTRNDALDLLARLEETPDSIPEDLLYQMRALRKNSESTQPTPQTEFIERLLAIIQKYEKRVKKQQRVSEKLLSAHRTLLEDFYMVSSGLDSSNYSKVIKSIKKRLRDEDNF